MVFGDFSSSVLCGREFFSTAGRLYLYLNFYSCWSRLEILVFKFFLAKLESVFSYVLLILVDAGWSSLVARQAHNLKVVGSNPTPATKSHRC